MTRPNAFYIQGLPENFIMSQLISILKFCHEAKTSREREISIFSNSILFTFKIAINRDK